MPILFIRGVNDQSEVLVTLNSEGKISHVLNGTCWVYGRVSLGDKAIQAVTLLGPTLDQPRIKLSRKPSLIFNEIADPDTCMGALKRCSRLVNSIGVPVINHPERITQTSRDRVSDKLLGIPGVIMPRTVRFQPRSPDDVISHADAVSYEPPYFARVAGLHNGKTMTLITDPSDHSELHALPFDGRDFYLTEFVDYSDDEGRFHKQRVLVIDGEPILRHAVYDREWNVHGHGRNLMREEEGIEGHVARVHRLETEVLPRLRPAIDEITKRLGLEYYGIDCHLDAEGNMLVFEANANMNTLNDRYPELEGRLDYIKDRISAMVFRHLGEDPSV